MKRTVEDVAKATLGPATLEAAYGWLRDLFAALGPPQQQNIVDSFIGGVELTTDYSGSGQAHWVVFSPLRANGCIQSPPSPTKVFSSVRECARARCACAHVRMCY